MRDETSILSMFGKTKTQIKIKHEEFLEAEIKNIEEFYEKCSKLKKDTFIPVTSESKVQNQKSKYGGMPIISSENSWPICGNCEKNMSFYAQLDSKELPGESGDIFGDGFLQIFYCGNTDMDCENECEAYLPFSKSTKVRIIPFDDNFISTESEKINCEVFEEKKIVSWNKKEVYPNCEEMGELGFHVNRKFYELELEKRCNPYGDNLLGYPGWVQAPIYPKCNTCNKYMNFIFQIDTDDKKNHSFPAIGYLYVFKCGCKKEQMTVLFSTT